MNDTRDADKKQKESKPDVSRRKFLVKAVTSATAVAALGNSSAIASDTPESKSIKVPDEFTQANKAVPVKADFPMTGAQVFARVCKEEGLAALFCCPGNYN